MRNHALILTAAVAAVLLTAPAALAQDPPPGTDVYLLEIARADDGIHLGKPANVTERKGYDNQPAFSPDGSRLFYTAIGDDGQSDIWVYDLGGKERRRLRETPESEYSPTPIPGEDAISVVRVEADSRQRLWRIPITAGEPDLLLPDVAPVGYHAWSDAKNLVLFVLGEPPTLQRAKWGKGKGEVLAKNAGRALKRVPGSSAVAFVHKEAEDDWSIKKVDLASGEIETILKTRPGREDFTFGPSGELFLGDGSVLYVARPGAKEWTKVADLEEHGIAGITRLAVHPDGDLMALVAEE